MTSTRERQQRAAARARLAREMAERQEAARQRRRRQAIFGAAAALVVVVGGVVWAVTAVTGDEEEPSTPPAAAESPAGEAAPGECEWLPEDRGEAVDVGTPPAIDPPAGPATMTIETNHGVIEVAMDAEAAPCTYTSFAHLADSQFYDDTTCHRLTVEGIYVLQCGDPSATGAGGPTYRYAEENLPLEEDPPYPAGTVAMAKTEAPSSTGSQFFIVYDESTLAPDYTVVGTVTEGLDIVADIAAGGLAEDGVAPATEVVIETLQVSEPEA